MSETNKKYFWLKLDKNFFKRPDIRIIEEQENGKDYILFYLKLLVESIDHEGYLRFNNLIPYDIKMLSVITNTNIDIAKQAVKIFTELEMMEIFDDGTIYMKEIQKMIGSECDSAKRVRLYRERKLLHSNVDVTNCNTEIEKEIEKEIELDKNTICALTRNVFFDEVKKCFEKFYAEYPKKKSPRQAETTFAKIVKQQKIGQTEELNKFTDMLIEAIYKQTEEKNNLAKYNLFVADWKHPSTWLNQECWKDEIKTEEQIKQYAIASGKYKLTFDEKLDNYSGEQQCKTDYQNF